MNRLGYFPLLLLLGWLAAPGAQAQSFFTGTFSAAQETHAVDSDATGTAALVLTDDGLRYFVTVEGLSGPITGAHFHAGSLGVSGGVVHAITDAFDGTTAQGTWADITDEQKAMLLAGDLYLNIHTDANAPGEIRAQVVPSAGAGLSATLTGAQESPSVDTDATGTAAVLATDAGVVYHITVEGLSGPITGAHFHAGGIGENGGVEHAITDAFDGTTAVGLWTDATDEQIALLLTGGLYLNIHTDANAPGEIRGQVLPTSGFGFSASLDGGQEVPPVDVEASGTATLTLTEQGLAYRITADGLTGPITGAHFHNAPTGANGGVVHAITDAFDGTTAVGLWPDVPPEMVAELLAGNLYLNLHTDANAPGEIRGQVTTNGRTHLSATLTGAQESPSVDTDATGTAAILFKRDGLHYRITVEGLSGPITGAHFHAGGIGENGGVEHAITDAFVGTTAEGVWDDITPEQIALLLTGGLYLNIHTDANAPGEIRGQVYLSSGAHLRASLSDEQETSPVVLGDLLGPAGTAALTLTGEGLVYHITAEGLSGPLTGAHFHAGAAGEAGGVEHGITDAFDGTTAAGVWADIDADQRAAVLTGDVYLNLHTTANMPGEIRGQVYATSGFGAAVKLTPEQETHDVDSDAQGTASTTLSPAGVRFVATVDDLSSDFQAAHFHRAPFGENGGVVRGITDAFDGATASGVWQPTDDEELTNDLMGAYLMGDLYLNVHTVDFAPGEVRGQIQGGSLFATGVEPVDEAVPEAFRLVPNYPNPFNPATTLEFALTEGAHARLTVFNTLGQRVATLVDAPLGAGTYRVPFDAAGLPSGIYLYRLEAAGQTQTRAMLLVK
ncbi:MAG: CHRD domain-containing protein [Rhodothermales bacterium]|nr:CHRD domain-containing protein [Rhodothermales bacterium]